MVNYLVCLLYSFVLSYFCWLWFLPHSSLWDRARQDAVKCFECECSVDLSSISMPACHSPSRLTHCPSPVVHTHFQRCYFHSNTLILFFCRNLLSISTAVWQYSLQWTRVGAYLKPNMASSQCYHSNKVSIKQSLGGWGEPLPCGITSSNMHTVCSFWLVVMDISITTAAPPPSENPAQMR